MGNEQGRRREPARLVALDAADDQDGRAGAAGIELVQGEIEVAAGRGRGGEKQDKQSREVERRLFDVFRKYAGQRG